MISNLVWKLEWPGSLISLKTCFHLHRFWFTRCGQSWHRECESYPGISTVQEGITEKSLLCLRRLWPDMNLFEEFYKPLMLSFWLNLTGVWYGIWGFWTLPTWFNVKIRSDSLLYPMYFLSICNLIWWLDWMYTHCRLRLILHDLIVNQKETYLFLWVLSYVNSYLKYPHITNFEFLIQAPGEGNGTPLQYSCLENPWTKAPGKLQSMGSRRVGHDWVTSLSLFYFMHWRRKWQPTPVFLPGESQGRRSLVGCRLWGRTKSDTTEAT